MSKLRGGQVVEPIDVRFDGARYFLYDGFHRLEAAKRVGLEKIQAGVSSGTLAEMRAEWQRGLEAIKRSLRGSA